MFASIWFEGPMLISLAGQSLGWLWLPMKRIPHEIWLETMTNSFIVENRTKQAIRKHSSTVASSCRSALFLTAYTRILEVK